MSKPLSELVQQELSSLTAAFEADFAGQARATRDSAKIEALAKRAEALLAQVDACPPSQRPPDFAALRGEAANAAGFYAHEQRLIADTKELGEDFLDWADAASRAGIVFSRYQRHFAGHPRPTRDLGLLGELIDELDSARHVMGEIARERGASRWLTDAAQVEESRSMYERERFEIENAQRAGSPDDRASLLALLANAQFKLVQDHFGGQPRATRRPDLMVRILSQLESVRARMLSLKEENLRDKRESNERNIEVVTTQLTNFGAELEEIRKVRQEVPLLDLAGMLGESANGVMTRCREELHEKAPKEVNLDQLSTLCDALYEIRRQMIDLDRFESTDWGRRNIEIVSGQLGHCEQQWNAARQAQGGS